MLTRARREAEQIVTSAQTQAESFVASGQAEAERQLADLHAEVDRITKRRDAIVAQLGALRDVVAGFAERTSSPRRPERPDRVTGTASRRRAGPEAHPDRLPHPGAGDRASGPATAAAR